MDILNIRDQIRNGEIEATIVNSEGVVVGTLAVEDIMFALAGMDTMDIYGKLTQECKLGTDMSDLSIDLGFIKFGGGEAVIKGQKEWKTLKKAYQLSGAREGRLYFHVDTMDIKDAVIESMPVFVEPVTEDAVGTLEDARVDLAEVAQ